MCTKKYVPFTEMNGEVRTLNPDQVIGWDKKNCILCYT